MYIARISQDEPVYRSSAHAAQGLDDIRPAEGMAVGGVLGAFLWGFIAGVVFLVV